MPGKKLHGYGTVIKNYRNNVGMSQAELADALSVKRATIVNWELERTQPDVWYMQALCDELNIPPSELLRVGPISFKSTYSEREKSLISLFRDLSSEGKELAEKQVFSILEMENNRRYHRLREQYRVEVRFTECKPAAGTGNPFTDERPKAQILKNTPMNAKADVIMTVDGRSMEPVYHSGDLVYVQYTQAANPGDVVICSTADGAVIKCVNDKRQLFSLNDEFPYGMKSEDDNVRVVGKVLGIVQPGDLPEGEELEELEEILSPEIAEYKRTHNAED